MFKLITGGKLVLFAILMSGLAACSTVFGPVINTPVPTSMPSATVPPTMMPTLVTTAVPTAALPGTGATATAEAPTMTAIGTSQPAATQATSALPILPPATASPQALATQAPSLPSTGAFNACNLITAQEVQTTLGGTPGNPIQAQFQGQPLTSCTYTVDGRSVTVVAGHFAQVPQAVAYFQAALALAQANQLGQGTFAQIPNLGDQAFRVVNSVAVTKDHWFYTVSVVYDGNLNASINQQKALSLAQLAITRLPAP